MVFLRRLFSSLASLAYCSEALASPTNQRTLQQGFERALRPGSPLQSVEQKPSRWRQPGPLTAPKDFEDWISSQRNRSMWFILDNIAPFGVNAKDAVPGAVLASPSKSQPDYYYQWVRDAAITMADVVKEFGRTKEPKLRKTIDFYASLQKELQNTLNPSGGYSTGGLGEPKFEVDGKPFMQHWGRPQRDGPALRALTLMKYIRILKETAPDTIDKDWLDTMYDGANPTKSIIKADLEYVAHEWHMSGFDLWEEIDDVHFFTALVQHKALVEGRDFALEMGDPEASAWYEQQQLALGEFLNQFWNEKEGHLMSMVNTPSRGGLDAALLLGAIHGGQENVFPPWSDEILASLEKLVADMAVRHIVNSHTLPLYPDSRFKGVGIGRYPEDIYDGILFAGGNPWFLCTSSVSNILYDTIIHYANSPFIINEINKAFFDSLHPTGQAELGHYATADPMHRHYLEAMFQYADSFLNVLRQYATTDGRMSEQFNGVTGAQQGAHDLTWSYGSFVTAVDKRTVAKKVLFEEE